MTTGRFVLSLKASAPWLSGNSSSNTLLRGHGEEQIKCKGLPTADSQQMPGLFAPCPNTVPKNKVPQGCILLSYPPYSVQPCHRALCLPDTTHRDNGGDGADTIHTAAKPQRAAQLTRASVSTSAPSSLSWRVSMSVNS